MQNPISLIRSQLRSMTQTGLPTGLAGASFWLALWFCLLFFLREVPGWGTFFGVLQIFVGVALAGVGLPFLWQLVRRRMLWSLRNKLVLTYLLIGLAPVVLFVTLVSISGYVAAGQFAIHLADSRMQAELSQMIGENNHRADQVAQVMEGQLAPGTVTETEPRGVLDSPRLKLHRETEVFVDGAPFAMDFGSAASPVSPVNGKTPLGLPAWATRLRTGEFHGLVLDGEDLYLVAIHQQGLKNGRMLSVVTSLPVNPPVMTMIASGLGVASLKPKLETDLTQGQTKSRDNRVVAFRSSLSDVPSITGGTQQQAKNVADIVVKFASTEPITDWPSGDRGNVFIAVISRPSLLYNQLFGPSISGFVTSTIQIALVLLCILFAIIELLALVMAIRLSRTITASVTDLYQATLQVDRGELNHQIAVTREDQLAELSSSFNRMTRSLQRLLVEQKEKERLQSELSIAQEVQANLFPRHIHNLATLELHGVCRPARSVSGDYYDFLVFYGQENGQARRPETGVAIAIGDISGKGISAALLMATLHSAVRAYRFANEEMVFSESSVAGLMASREERSGAHDELFESPGRILSLLNRHLFRSTQPEKYATLFLAHYDVGSSVLTYSNAGQLPPLVLGRDGNIRRLDKGGTVVGLMDGMHYDEGRLQMQPGDIMVAYSDGVTEPENDFGDFGEERLMEVVRRHRDQPLHVISTQVMQALDAWIGAEEQPDDITLVLARQI